MSRRALWVRWNQEGFTAEPPNNDSGTNFQWNDSDSGPKVRVTVVISSATQSPQKPKTIKVTQK